MAHGVAGRGTIGLQAVAQKGCRPWHIGLQAWGPKDLSLAGPMPLIVPRCLVEAGRLSTSWSRTWLGIGPELGLGLGLGIGLGLGLGLG